MLSQHPLQHKPIPLGRPPRRHIERITPPLPSPEFTLAEDDIPHQKHDFCACAAALKREAIDHGPDLDGAVLEVDFAEADEADVVGCCVGVGVVEANGPAWVRCVTGDASVDVVREIFWAGERTRVDLQP